MNRLSVRSCWRARQKSNEIGHHALFCVGVCESVSSGRNEYVRYGKTGDRGGCGGMGGPTTVEVVLSQLK